MPSNQRWGRRCRRIRTGVWLVCALCLSPSAQAREIRETVDGGTFSYPSGKPRIVSETAQLAPGQATPWHCHPVPTLTYIQEGRVRLETQNGQSVILAAGESMVEPIRAIHRGVALDQPVTAVLFRLGVEDTPVTVRHDADDAPEHCDMGSGDGNANE